MVKGSCGESLATIWIRTGKIEGVEYRIRQGVYGVMVNREDNSVAVLKTSTGCFLPGGGVEGDETHEECLKRECIEEIGYEVRIGDFIGSAERYFYSTTHHEYMVSDGYFFLVNVNKKLSVSTEDDHELVWISQSEIEESLFHEHQIWAVKQVISGMAG